VPASFKPDHIVDTADLGCGELMIALHKTMKDVEPGQLLELHSADPGAPEDIPAWCRLTGNTLMAGPTGDKSQTYFIQKKGE